MSIVKHSKSLNSLQLQKKRFPYWNKSKLNLLPSLLLAALLGTYLDLYLVGKGLFSFPNRPFPALFSVNIGFTLVVLPVCTALFLLLVQKMKRWQKVSFIVLLSMLASVFEKQAIAFGLFAPSTAWDHRYSFIGYGVYLFSMYLFFKLTNQN